MLGQPVSGTRVEHSNVVGGSPCIFEVTLSQRRLYEPQRCAECLFPRLPLARVALGPSLGLDLLCLCLGDQCDQLWIVVPLLFQLTERLPRRLEVLLLEGPSPSTQLRRQMPASGLGLPSFGCDTVSRFPSSLFQI